MSAALELPELDEPEAAPQAPLLHVVPAEVEPIEQRYLLFSGNMHWAGGGWRDFKLATATFETALEAGESLPDEWWHIVDLHTLSQVASEGLAYGTPTPNPFAKEDD